MTRFPASRMLPMLIAASLTLSAGAFAADGKSMDKPATKSAALTAANPFYAPSKLQYQAPVFDKIKDSDYAPALDEGMRQQRKEIDAIANSPAAPNFQNTIVGMSTYCKGFAKVKPAVADINTYETGTNVVGISAPNDTTLVFKLLNPAPDFLNILSLPFYSARPIEYMAYLPDSAPFRANTLSDGPYEISNYTAGKSFTLVRNPEWKASSDPLRKAYVDEIDVTEGLTSQSVQQQLQVGTGDMEWDVTPPTQSLPALQAQKDKNLIIGPSGSAYVSLGNYLALNQYKGPMKSKLVRQAVAIAVNKNAIVQILGGKSIASTTGQIVLPGSVGYVKGLNPYPDNNGAGNAVKAKALLKQAGYPKGVSIKLLYSTTDPAPRIAQAMQASLQAAGFKVKLVPSTQSDFYGKYLYDNTTAKSDQWDIASAGWIPDWFGNNGRSVIVPLLTAPGPGSSDFGGYNSPVFNKYVNQALTATSSSAVAAAWAKANSQAMDDLAIVPVNVAKWPVYHSSRVQGCNFFWYSLNCDLTSVWLSK